MFEHFAYLTGATAVAFLVYLAAEEALIRTPQTKPNERRLLACAAFSVMMALCIANGHAINPGVIVDGRGAVLAVATMAGGYRVGAVTALAGMLTRWSMGGDGMSAGFLGLAADLAWSILVVALGRRQRAGWMPRLAFLILAGVGVGATEALSLLWVPTPIGQPSYFALARWDLFFTQVFSVLLLGGLIHLQQDRQRARQTNDALLAELKENRNRLRSLIDNLPDPAWLKDADRRYLAVNVAWTRYFHLEESQVLGRTVDEFVPPALAQDWNQREIELIKSRRPVREELVLSPPGAPPATYEVWMPCFGDAQGLPQGMVGIARDITDRKNAEHSLYKSNRALRARSACSQALARAGNEADALREICRIILQQGSYRLVWVGFPNETEGRSIRVSAYAGSDPPEILRARATWAENTGGGGPTHRCLQTCEPVILRDIAQEPHPSGWHAEALAFGFGSMGAFPLLHAGQRIGVLVAYASSANAFDRDDVGLLAELVDDLALAVNALRGAQARQRAESQLQKTVRYQRALSTCSVALREAPHLAEGITSVMELLRRASDVDRVYLFENQMDPKLGLCASQKYERVRAGISPQLGNPDLQGLPYSVSSPSGYLLRLFEERRPCRGPVSQLPPAERAILEMQGILDVLILPIHAANHFWGFLGFDDCTETGRFDDDDVALLQNAADLIGWHVAAARDRLQLEQVNQQLESRVAERTSEALELYNKAPCGYHSLDARGLVLQMNDTELGWLGYRREEVEGRLRLPDLLSPLSAANFETIYADLVAHESPSTIEWECRRKDGTTLHVLAHSVAVRDAAGHFLRTRSAVLDITLRKQAETALQEERRRLAGIIEGTGVGTWEWNVQTGETTFNHRWAEMLGWKLAELQPTTHETMVRMCHPDDVLTIDTALARHFFGQVPYCEVEFRMQHRDQSWLWVVSRGRVTARDDAGRPLWMQGTLQDITTRKRLEQNLRENEEKYRLIIESSRDAIILTGVDGRLLEVNSAALQVFEFPSKAQMLSHHLSELSPPLQLDGRESATVIRESIQRIKQQGSMRFEWQHLRADGSQFPAEVSANACVIQGKEVMLGIVRDITNRKAAEEELRRSEAKFRQLVEMAPFAIGLSDQHGRITYLNHRFTQNFGYQAHDIPTLEEWYSRAYPDEATRRISLHRWEDYVRQAEDLPASLEPLEFRITAQDGFIHDVLISGIKLDTELLVTFLDITGLKRANEMVRNLSQAVRFSPNMILITDRYGRVVYVNPAFETCTGFALSEVVGHRFTALKSGLHPPEFYTRLWEEISAGRIWRGEFCNRRKNGELYWESAAIAPVHDETGVITHFVAVKEDITLHRQASQELRRAKEAADAANRAKSVFLANMSHEIRTPMTAILGFSQLLLQDASLAPPQRESVNTIIRSGEHLLDIINDILEMARLESGRTTFNPQPFDLIATLQDVERMFTLRAHDQGLTLSFTHDASLPQWVVSDRIKFRQVLINLLSNAVKFTPAGGSVSVHVQSHATPGQKCTIEVSVTDTGVGVAEEDVPRLFEPFFQTEAGKQLAGGTGLGLSISQEFARLLGGRIHVTSQPGAGSTFALAIQAQVAQPGTLVGVLDEGAASREIPVPAPSAGQLASLPAEWTSQFRTAIFRAEYEQIMLLLERVEGLHPELARALRPMAAQFDYAGLLKLLETPPSPP